MFAQFDHSCQNIECPVGYQLSKIIYGYSCRNYIKGIWFRDYYCRVEYTTECIRGTWFLFFDWTGS